MPLKKQTAAQVWQEFAKHVFRHTGIKPGSVQYREMRRAFYGGMFDMLMCFHDVGAPDVTEEEGADYLEALKKELDQFYRDLKTGKPGV